MFRLFQPVDIASLVFFRIAFGVLGFADVLATWLYYDLHEGDYDLERFRFSYIGFEWVQPLPEPFLSVFFIILMACAISIVIGWRYKLSASLFALGFTYVFLLEKAHYLNHGYLFCWISFVMIVLPADRYCALDARRKPELRARTAPFWSIGILMFLMSVVYIYGGIAKINSDWLRGVPLVSWLSQKGDIPIVGTILTKPSTAYIMAYGGMAFDLCAPFLLLCSRTRIYAFAIAIAFHLLNTIVFQIGIFPWLSLSLTALFFAPDFPRKLYRRLPKRLQILRNSAASFRSDYWQFDTHHRTWIMGGLLLIGSIHLLIPLRHHLYKGDVAWTEEGHRYSWRMMLRSKQGYGRFTIKDVKTDSTIVVRPAERLGRRQTRKLYTHPDMIWQFAQHLKKEYEAKGQSVQVFADIQVKLNDRDYQAMVDPAVDLAAVQWEHFRTASWIVPLKEK